MVHGQVLAKVMVEGGFKQGTYNPCTYDHAKKKIRARVHGDDFVTQGEREDAERMKKKLDERFEIKTKTIGLGEREVRETRL